MMGKWKPCQYSFQPTLKSRVDSGYICDISVYWRWTNCGLKPKGTIKFSQIILATFLLLFKDINIWAKPWVYTPDAEVESGLKAYGKVSKFTFLLRHWATTGYSTFDWYIKLLTHSCLEIYLTSVIRTSQSFGNYFWMKHQFANYLKEICRLSFNEQLSLKSFQTIAFVKEISPK